MTQVNVETLGCFPMDATNGTLTATAQANVGAINDYLGGEYRPSRLPLVFPGRGWLIADTIDLQNQTGHVLLGCGGEPIWQPEIEYNSVGEQGGPVSRLVADQILAFDGEGGLAGKPLIRIRGYGNHVQRLALQGQWGATAIENIDDPDPANWTYPKDGLNFDSHSAPLGDLRAWFGIEVQGQQDGLGTGKLICPGSLAIMLFRVAIKCIPTPIQDNADQLFLDRFFAPFCDIGLWCTNLQSVGHRIAYFDQIWCNTGFRFDAGGKLWCGDLVMQSGSQYGLLLTGRDSDVGGNRASFRIDRLTIDGSAPDDCQAVRVEPPMVDPPEDPQPYSYAQIDIGFLHVDSNRSQSTPAHPLIVLDRFYGDVNIYGGVYLYQGMIKVTGGTEDYFPTIRIHNARIAKGNDPRAVLSSDSTGYVQFELKSCCEMDGATGAINSGKMFPEFQGLIDRSAVPPAVVSGGYIYRRGNIVTTSSSYGASELNETFEMSGSGASLYLPIASSVRGIIYFVKNTSSGNITVDPSGTETIDGAPSLLVMSGERWTIQSDGAGWITI